MEKIDEAAKEIKPTKYDRPENYKPPAPKAKPAAKIKTEPVGNADGGDEGLMDFSLGPPKKKPPPGLG